MSDDEEYIIPEYDTITGSAQDDEERTVRVVFEIVPGIKPSFSPSFGNFLPGDPPEFRVKYAEREVAPDKWEDVTPIVEDIIDLNEALSDAC